MKTYRLIIFFIAILALSFAIGGYFKAAPVRKESLEKNAPQIVIEPKSFDFGKVEFGKTVEHTFTVKNTGGEPLEIKRVSTSCGCTQAEINKEKIEPGETASLLVTYDSGAMGKSILGKRIQRFVYVRSNDPQTPQAEVTIYVRVE